MSIKCCGGGGRTFRQLVGGSLRRMKRTMSTICLASGSVVACVISYCTVPDGPHASLLPTNPIAFSHFFCSFVLGGHSGRASPPHREEQEQGTGGRRSCGRQLLANPVRYTGHPPRNFEKFCGDVPIDPSTL